MKKRSGLYFVLGMLILAVSGISAPVPDTGQTQCYDSLGYEIPCPLPGQPLYGQDANYTIKPMSFTKLDSNGNALDDSATTWAMVRDNVTGLIWEGKRNYDGETNYNDPHDADNHYSWYNPTDPYPGKPGDGTDTQDLIDTLNTERFGGYSDWRIPTFQELENMVDCSKVAGPTIDTGCNPI